MRRFTSIFLFFIILGLGTGFFQRLHMMQHEQEDAQAAIFNSHATPSPEAPKHHHSEENCPTCAQFHAPINTSSYIVWLMDTGTWVPFVSMLPVSQHPQSSPSRISCRGPPSPASC